MNTRDPQTLFEKLKALPPERVAEVEDFVDFLATRDRRGAFDRLLAMAPAIERAGGKPMSAEEVVALVKDVRAERRAQRDRANRS
jgi:hypothetical protein